MAYVSLKEFVDRLDKAGELARVDTFVDPVLEIPEITDRVSKSPDGGKALLFTNTGTDFPVLMNAMGSYRRMCMALGVNELDDIGRRIDEMLGKFSAAGGGLMQKLAMLPRLRQLASVFPAVTTKKAPCQEVIHRDPDLSILPVLKTWPHDGGRFVTLPIVHTVDPETGDRNAGMYRMQIFDSVTTGMHWHRHKTGALHYSKYKKLGRKMPVAVALGGDPVFTYSATAPLPDNIDEYLFAGFLRGKSVNMVKCLTQDIEVPADADIVIEGYVDPTEDLHTEGPFGDHTGFYSLEDDYPLFHVTCITHRQNATYPATIVGIPPQEDAWIARATERIFMLPIRKTVVPELTDMEIPELGVAHNLTIAGIEKSYPGQARKVMNALWGAGQMMFNKVLVVADQSFDIHNPGALVKKLREIEPEKHLLFSDGPLDVLDHSSDFTGYGSKVGIDLTNKFPEELLTRSDVKEIKKTDIFPGNLLDRLIVNAVRVAPEKSYKGYCLMNIRKQEGYEVNLMCNSLALSDKFKDVTFFFFADPGVDPEKPEDFFWFILNNVQPMRDIRILETGNGKVRLFVDGTSKTLEFDNFHRPWPNPITMDEEIIRKVDNRWNEYNCGNFLASPSLRFRKLIHGKGAVAFNNNTP